MFLEILQNSQENTSARVSFILKERPWHNCFPVNFAKFQRTPFPFLIDHLWWLPQLLIICKYSQRTIPNKYLLIESEICSKLPIRKPEGCHWHCSGVFIFGSLNILHVLLWCFPCWLWTSNCQLGDKSYHINIFIIHACI